MPEYFYYNKAAYTVAGKRGLSVFISQRYTYRGQKAASIEVRPVNYDPVNNVITVAKSFTVTFRMKRPRAVRHMGSQGFDKVMRSIFVNLGSEQSTAVPSATFHDREKYLIIASSTYYDNTDLQRFIDFHNGNHEVELVQSSTVGSSKDDYKSFIRGKMPTYCLLVGRYQDFPSHSYNSTPSYIYYVSEATSSPKPDIALGLFFVRDGEDLKNVVDKSITTAQNIGSYPKHHIAFGGNTQQMGNLPPNHCDVIVREMYDDYMVPDGGWEITECYQVNEPRGGKEEAIAAMNPGVRFINYNGHGMSSGWTYGNGSWRTSSIGNVSNTVYPFVMSFCCSSGDFTSNSACWAEYWIGHENLSSAIIASSTTSTTSMHPLNRGVFKAIFEDKITKFGLAFVSAESYAYDSSSSNVQLAIWQFHYFGDPSMETMSSDPYISVSSPNGGEEWEQGTTQNIKWGDNIDGNVKIELFKGGSLKETLAASTESDGSFDWTIAGNYETGDDYKIKVTSVDSSQLFDESDENFSIIEEYIIRVFPYIEDFDDLSTNTTVLPKKWEQLSADDLQWTVWTGKTPSKEPDQGAATGPDNDHTSGSGNYIYVESSSPNNPDKKADYTTCKLGLNYLNDPELSFWYHMFSDNSGQDEMGDLYLDICVDGTWKNEVLHLSGNKGDQWFEQKVDLTDHKGERVILRFRAITGSGWASDICIDDFKVDGQMAIDHITVNTPSFFNLRFYNSRVHYNIPQRAEGYEVFINLYNVQGKLVQSVVNGKVKAGSYSIPLNRLATGLYLLKMETKEYNTTTNIIITR
jgi:hypothetical protein